MTFSTATEELHLFEVDDQGRATTVRSKTSRSATLRADDLAEAVILLNRAQANLAAAVDAARRRGWSWRRIGTESGLPFQTLHRRFEHRSPEKHGHTPTID